MNQEPLKMVAVTIDEPKIRRAYERAKPRKPRVLCLDGVPIVTDHAGTLDNPTATAYVHPDDVHLFS